MASIPASSPSVSTRDMFFLAYMCLVHMQKAIQRVQEPEGPVGQLARTNRRGNVFGYY